MPDVSVCLEFKISLMGISCQVIQTSSQCLAFYLNDRPPKLIWISGSLQTDAHGVKALPSDRGRAAALLVAGAQRHLQIDATSQFERSE